MYFSLPGVGVKMLMGSLPKIKQTQIFQPIYHIDH